MTDTPGTHPEVWVVRHGETDWSRAGRHTSRTDLPLTSDGETEARGLRSPLEHVEFATVLTSPLRRARDTAHLAGFGTATLEPTMIEWSYGEYEGLTTPEIREHVPGWTVWTHDTPGGESAGDVGRRVDGMIERVIAGGDERTLVFTHAHVGRVLAARWIGLAPNEGRRFRLDTATVSVLSWDREARAIGSWNR